MVSGRPSKLARSPETISFSASPERSRNLSSASRAHVPVTRVPGHTWSPAER
jgi:hypothetical protein